MSRPLRRIFTRRLNLLAIIAAVLLGAFLVKGQRMILLADLKDKGESSARILAAVTLDAAMVHDYATIERYVADIIRDPTISFIEIRRADNELLARAGSRAAAGARPLVVRQPITLGASRFGVITIALSTRRVNALSRNLFFSAIFAVIFFHFLVLHLSGLALKKAVIEPLGMLSRAMAGFRPGQPPEPVAVEEPEEIAALARSFTEMAATIRANFDAINQQREELRLEQNKLATIVDSTADGLFVTDTRGVILTFNRSASEITGYSEEEAIGTRCVDLFKTTLCKDACALHNAGETVRNRETTLEAKDGRLLTVSVSSALIFDRDGEAVGGVQTFRDITLEKKRQEMYCHTEKLAAIGQLAAGVAHEINNPLSNIIGYARMIRPEKGPEETARRVEVIVEQAGKCSEIVRGLLDFSRSSGAEPSLFEIAPLIARVVDMVGYQAEKQGTTIHLNPAPGLSVFADPGKIEQVVFNLLINALQTEPPAANIWVETGLAGKNTWFSVADDGPGIDPALRQKVFDPFFSTKPVGRGTGLGLSICAGIVADADGSIDLEERAGGGTVFTVFLPSRGPEEES